METKAVIFKLSGPDVRFDSFSWADFSAWMDLLFETLESIPGGPAASDVVVQRLDKGSHCTWLEMSPAHQKIVYAMRNGQTSRWAARERAAVAHLVHSLERREQTLEVGMQRSKLKPIRLRPADEASALRAIFEEVSTVGQVLSVGGTRATVKIRFPQWGLVTCEAGRGLAREAAQHLYQHAMVRVRRELHQLSLLPISVRMLAIEPIEGRLSLGQFAAIAEEEAEGREMPYADEFLEKIGR